MTRRAHPIRALGLPEQVDIEMRDRPIILPVVLCSTPPHPSPLPTPHPLRTYCGAITTSQGRPARSFSGAVTASAGLVMYDRVTSAREGRIRNFDWL